MIEYKNYKIKGDGTFGYMYIQNMGSGQIPPSLKGAFTTPAMAKRAIDVLLASKGDSNGSRNEGKAKRTKARAS